MLRQREQLLSQVSTKLERTYSDIDLARQALHENDEPAIVHATRLGVLTIKASILSRAEELLTPEQEVLQLFNKRDSSEGKR